MIGRRCSRGDHGGRPLQRQASGQLEVESPPPFLEPDFREPALERFVEEVLLEAAAARLVEPVLFLDEDRVPDFVPPRADDVDFFDAAERPLFEADLLPPLVEDLDAPLADDFFEAVRDVPFEAAFFAPPLVVDLDALFLAPLFAVDFDALFLAPPEDVRAAPLFDEAPLFADDLVLFFAPEDELLAPLFLPVVEVAEPPEEPAVLG